MEVRVQIDNAAAITRAFVQAPAMVLDELQATMGSLMAYLHRETAENTPTAAGLLRQAWLPSVQVNAATDMVIGRLTNPLPYALPVEQGTRPHWAPLAPLINWAEQKLHLAGDEAEAAARAIQRKIASRGTLARGMAHFALADARSTIEAEFADCAQRIKARLAAADGAAA